MNWLDILILVIVGVNTFTGLKRGLIKSALSLVGLIVGVILAGRFYTQVTSLIPFISNENIANGVAFVLILIVVMVIASVAASLMKWVASTVMLGWANYLGGAVFGLLLGAISVGALLTLWVNFLDSADVVQNSIFASFLLDQFPIVLALLPDEFNAIRDFFE